MLLLCDLRSIIIIFRLQYTPGVELLLCATLSAMLALTFVHTHTGHFERKKTCVIGFSPPIAPAAVLLLDDLDGLVGFLAGEVTLQQLRLDTHVAHHHHHLQTI